MHLFFEEGMRGSISIICNRYLKANNPYLSDFDPHLPTSYIIYLDANNLYGSVMIQPLPVGEFEWMTEEQIKHFKVEDIPDDADYGYALQVDLHYPPELHDLHSDYPLGPGKSITHEMLSPYQQELEKELGYEPAQTEKLLPNLWDKEKCILHYRDLKLYLSLGMKLTKIHCILKFIQQAWLKPYTVFTHV